MTRTSSGRTDGKTRHRILRAASELFAQKGFHATTTREIARAVGIRQPSLFHHFRSKAAIAEALYEWDLGLAAPQIAAIASEDAPAAVRLYRYLQWDVQHLVTADYDLSGIYGPDVIRIPEFAPWISRVAEMLDAVEGIVREGVEEGDLIPVDPAIVREAIHGILDRALFLHDQGHERLAQFAEEAPSLLVRGLLVDPLRIDEVRTAATIRGAAPALASESFGTPR